MRRKAHPRYDEDFASKMPDDIRKGDADTQAEWLFHQASIWPDLVRSGPAERRAYNRPKWHYINEPQFLTGDDYKAMHDKVDVNLETEPPANDFDDREMNIVQAINNSMRIVNDVKQPAELRAVHLCWLFHCISDIHQPLHTTALFSRHLFPQGDRGGNLVKTKPLGNLHSAWDRSFGSDSFRNTRNTAIKLRSGAFYPGLRGMAAELMSPIRWKADAFGISRGLAYDREVKGQLKSLEKNGGDINAEPVQLSEHYLRQRRGAADEMAVVAGVRLAAVLAEVP